jgi:unsaturated rhamnogalacturonyl hydrolase
MMTKRKMKGFKKMTIQKEFLMEKLERVVNKLMNLDQPTFDKELLDEGDAAISKGVITRDFGITEWDWPQGVGIYGLWQLGKYKKTGEYNEFLYNWYANNLNFGLPSRNVNTTAPLLTLVELTDVYDETRFKELCIDWANWLMHELPRTKENGFQHVTTDIKDRYGIILNEGQMWIDTLFMMVLFLNKIGVEYNKKEWIEEANYQVLIHIKYLYEKKNGLFHHGWSFEENGNFGEVFWCRGNSWFTNGMMDYIENCGHLLDDGLKTFIINTYKAQVDALIKLQSENGLWLTVLDDPSSYIEVSGSAAIAAGILKGVRNGILDESYRAHALKAIEAILNNISEDGTVLNVSGGTGIGYNKEHYNNIIIAPMAYGQSLTIIALTEALYHI